MMLCVGRLGGGSIELEPLANDVTQSCAHDQMSVT